MTIQELRFLEYYAFMRFRIIKSIDSNGYQRIINAYKYLLAKKIIEKYERQAEDPEIFSRWMV